MSQKRKVGIRLIITGIVLFVIGIVLRNIQNRIPIVRYPNLLVKYNSYGVFIIFCCFLGVASIIGGCVAILKDKNAQEAEMRRKLNEQRRVKEKNEYELYKEKYTKYYALSKFTITNIDTRLLDSRMALVWKDDNNIYFFPNDAKFLRKNDPLVTINLNEIKYFEMQGNIYREQIITGGDGGGSSVKGAVVGGLIAGEAGAIIGSRKATESISTEYREKDTRMVIIKLKNGREFKFLRDTYEKFVDLIPDKEKIVVDSVRRNNIVNEQRQKRGNLAENAEIDLTAKLKKLKELYEQKLITLDEYEAKKQKLLDDL